MQEAKKDFEKLKKDMYTTLALATLDFTKTFIMDCDALVHGFGVLLMK